MNSINHNCDSLNKYSKKIIAFICSLVNDFSINYDDINFTINKFIESNIYKQITKIIDDSYKSKYHLKNVINKYHIMKAHQIKNYPMMYILFLKLYEKKLINEIFEKEYNFDEIIYDFKIFIIWFNEHSNEFDIERMHYIVSNYIKNIKNINDDNDDDELQQIYTTMYGVNGHREELHKMLYNNRFLPLDVQHNAESFDMTKYVINNDDFSLVIYSRDDDIKLNIMINNIIHIIYIMKSIGKIINNETKPNIIILLGTQKKQLNEYDNLLSSTNINSGSSISGINIMIWRKEEIYKVLIHELIHFFEIDFNIFDEGYTKLNKYLCKKYNIEFIDCPNESYTECLAILINSCFVSFHTNIAIDQILLYEMIYTIFQISKILTFFEINSSDELYTKKITQTTSVFSYFIVKGALLCNLSNLINMMKDDVKNIAIKNKVETFSNLVKQSLNNLYFQKIDNMIKIFKNIKNQGFIMKTLRMSCFQI